MDGLRALAVVPVILFHAELAWFGGGYVGVDVFFVISGYLITSLILAEQSAGHFSILSFYERRARRILPALFVVTAACLIPAWLWMFPHLLEDFGRSLIAVALFSSNFLFWKESDYFNSGVEETPLLHTWSLAVEEQYYVVFPVLLMLLWALGRRRVAGTLLILAVASLAAAEWGWRNAPSANFYLTTSRAWELLLGALVAFAHHEAGDENRIGRLLRNILAALGLSLIVYAVLMFDEQTPFPSLYALVPTMGAALVLAFGSSDTWVGKALSLRFIVLIGLLSYSLYLWHQPLFAFARIRTVPTPWLYLLLIGITAALAYATWRFVETPLRNRAFLSRRSVFALSAAGTLILAAFGLAFTASQGFENRLTPGQAKLLGWMQYPRQPLYRHGVCMLRRDQGVADFDPQCWPAAGSASLLVWGDSHGAHLFPGLAAGHAAVGQLTSAGCPPVLDYRIANVPACSETNEFVMRQLDTGKYAVTIVAANWALHFPRRGFRARLEQTLGTLAKTDTRAVVIGPVPQWAPSLPERAARISRDGRFPQWVQASSLHELRELDSQMKALTLAAGLGYVSLLDAFCNASSCRAAADELRAIPMAWDYGHLTREGSVLVARLILDTLQTTPREQSAQVAVVR